MKHIVAMTFPKQNLNLGLEPSILTVVPNDTEDVKVHYVLDQNNIEYKEEDVLYYMCSIYITGMDEFFEWAKKHDKNKIITGGYEPTINPHEFEPYSKKVIIGPCDSFNETIKQEGTIVKGITTNWRIPRYDLYDVRLNQQIIPDKRKDDIVTSINTSQGCPFQCDFCCSPLMCDHIMSKPLSLVQEEINYLKSTNAKFIFIRDENFPLQRDWKEKLKIINQLGAKIYLFASSNLCTEENIKFMKENGVYMICLGLEDITVEYGKNKELDKTCRLLHKYGIYVYLSFIVDPLKINTDQKSFDFYKKLLSRFKELKPEMVCGNFLMPFRGTKIWDKYKDYVGREDFKDYNSKSAFLEKDKLRRFKDEYDMFYYQYIYYHSIFYKENIREFNTNDTLYLRFEELKREFAYKLKEKGIIDTKIKENIIEEKQEIGRFTATTFNGKELLFIAYNNKTIDCPTLGLNNYHKLIIKPRFELIKPNIMYEYNKKANKKYTNPQELIASYSIDEPLFTYLKDNKMIMYSTDMAYLYGFADKKGYDFEPYTPGEKRKNRFKRIKDKSKILINQKQDIFN